MEEMVVEGSQVEERCAIVQPPLLVAKLTKCPQTLYNLEGVQIWIWWL